MLAKTREAFAEKKRLEESRREQIAALNATRAAIQKVRTATPATFEKLKKEVDDILSEELAKCGPEAANVLFTEAEKHIDFARQRVSSMEEQAKKLVSRREEMARLRAEAYKDATDPTAPPRVHVPGTSVGAVLGRGGSTLKMVVSKTGCKIDRGAFPSLDGSVAFILSGKAPQRRLAKEMIYLLVDGGDADDVAARLRGAVIVPHGLGHRGREEWLAWRLKAVEFDTGLKVELTRNSVRLLPQEGGPSLEEGSEDRLAAVELVDGVVAEAQALVELSVDAKAEREPTDERLTDTVGPLADQYGVLSKPLEPEDDIVPVLVLGPADAARDAAAILWSRFVQGKTTAAILTVPGRVQSMSSVMSQDFDKDLRALEEDAEVEVTQSSGTLWISGSDEEAVAEAKKTVADMLQFYMPQDFLLLDGLSSKGLQALKQDAELRVIVLDPNCVVNLDVTHGSAWICGPRSGPAAAAARRRVEALAREGGASEEAKAVEAAAVAAAAAAEAAVLGSAGGGAAR